MFKSLRARLLGWLVIPLLFMSAAHLYTSNLDTKLTSQKIFDRLLVTLAISISEHALSSGGDLLTDSVLELIKVTTNDNLYYKVIGPDASFVSGYENIPEPPDGINILESNIKFYDAIYLEQPVRVIAISVLVNNSDYEGWMTTFVAQTLHDREEYVQSFLVNDLYRVILMIVIASILLSIGVSLGLRPLKKLQDSVHSRSEHDLSPIFFANSPKEITGLVAELNNLLLRMAEHLQLTKRFVENAAHQLRTPVTALLPQTELALRNAKSDRERKALTDIKKSASDIARLTHQLLHLTYAESIFLSQSDYPIIDLAVIAKKTAILFSDMHPQLDLSVTLDPAPIEGIEMFIEEVLKNLLDNAKKYSAEQVKIEVLTYQSASHSILEVRDDGPGIPLDQCEHVTERFVRLDNQQRGSGLGLSIVKEIVEAHNGVLHIGSDQGKGKLVSCRFPRSN
ncbi:MAG: sensor histidine kinase [Paraglaciecola sp.]|nr:sensor histidine kinase [Paraglaciecola sp.]